MNFRLLHILIITVHSIYLYKDNILNLVTEFVIKLVIFQKDFRETLANISSMNKQIYLHCSNMLIFSYTE